ncbi:MAG TPA: 5'-nucleotidase [Myxococcales bacterium]|nr:5'-nucleotidase [Myxococcales bacterium]
MLVVDAGNALFEGPNFADPGRGKAKAEFILRTMGELKTAAMAVGARDLTLGPDFLAQAARKAGVPLLSANLVRAGKPIFPASTTVTVAGVKIGLIGISPPLPPTDQFPSVRGDPPVKAALAEAGKLRGKVDLVVALAAVSYADALQLAKDGGPLFDLVLESGEMRPLGSMQQSERAYVVAAGERGRGMGMLELDLSAGGNGPLLDVASIERDRTRQRNLETQVQEVKRRLATQNDPAVVKSYQQALASFEDQIRQIQASKPEERAKGARTVRLATQFLDESVPDDPELKAQVDKLQPPS